MTQEDKKRAALATKNIAKAIGDSEFNALINTLEQKADIEVNLPNSPAAQ
jgi:peptidyl-prolyl cis-trans isomerase D